MSRNPNRRGAPRTNPNGEVKFNQRVGNKTREKLRQFETNVKKNATFESKQNTNVKKIQNIDEHEREALEYKKLVEQQKILRQKRRDRIESLIKQSIRNIVGNSTWRKDKVTDWMDEVIDSVGDIFSNELPQNSVFKYSIDCIIIKNSPISRQSEAMKSNNTDFQYNIKYKNNYLIVLVNAYAFRVATG